MGWNLMMAAPGADRAQGIATNTSLSGLLAPALVLVVIVVLLLVVSYIAKMYWNSRHVSLDWRQFEELILKMQLTHEEASFLRTNLRKLRYDNPTEVLRKESEFDKFFQKVMHRPNHHHEYLLQVVKKKVFASPKRPSVKPSPDREKTAGVAS